MKTTIDEKKFDILKKDEKGLIPSEAKYALVSYRNGKPYNIYFFPDVRNPMFDKVSKEELKKRMKEFNEEYSRVSERINYPSREKGEVVQIVNRLEASLVD